MDIKIKYVLVLVMSFILLLELSAQPAMINVKGGKYVRGCTAEQKPGCDGDEYPIHAVEVYEFNISKYEITQDEWLAVMGDKPSSHGDCGGNCPVETIDWYSAIIFCNEQTLANDSMSAEDLVYYKDEALTLAWSLSDYGGDGDTPGASVFKDDSKLGYRLPTEAEWEFAARGGNQRAGYKYSGSNNLEEVAWYEDNSEDTCHPVGTKAPNELGIFDMSGNVWEWVWDWYGDYEATHVCNPQGSASGTSRIYRGGSYNFKPPNCRVAGRYFRKPTRSGSNTGFRVVHGLL